MFETDDIEYTDEELDLIYNIEIIFTDYFPCDKIFKDSKYATIEELDICVEVPSEKYMVIAKSIAEELRFKGNDIEQWKAQVKSVCERYGMDLKIEEWVSQNTFIYNEKIKGRREIHDKVTRLVVEDIFWFQIEESDDDGKIRKFVTIDKTLIRKIARFLESSDK